MARIISFASLFFLIGFSALTLGFYLAYSDSAPFRWFKSVAAAVTAFSDLETSDTPSDLIRVADQRNNTAGKERFSKLDRNGENILVAGGVGQFEEVCGPPGCLAAVYDRSGKIVHQWPVNVEALLKNTVGEEAPYEYRGSSIENDFTVVGLRLFENGDLLVNLNIRNAFPYSWGMARISKDGEIVWRKIDYLHHWADLADDGLIYSPYYEIRTGERYKDYEPSGRPFLICTFPGKQYADLVHVLSPDGETLREIDLVELFGKSETYNYIFSRTTDRCDPLHLNYVHVASKSAAQQIDWLEEGDLLVSLRSLSAVAVINNEGTAIKKVYTGTFTSQHSAHFGEDGHIYLFDNMGTSADTLPSRLIAINMTNDEEKIVYSRSPDDLEEAELTEASGNLDIDTLKGRALMAYTQAGRVTEVDIRSGNAVSIFDNWHDGRPDATGLYKTYGAWYVSPEITFAPN